MRCRVAAAVTLAMLVAPAAADAGGCGAPGARWEQRTPAQVQMDARKLRNALDWATLHTSTGMVVVRHGCLVGQSRLDALTSNLPIDAWSMTKSVTALVIGRAVTLGYVKLDEPIRRLFPEADPAHAALTPRELMGMTSGLHRNWVRDISPQPDGVRDALALPFDHAPGLHWEYGQSPVNLAVAAAQRAIGRDFQTFAQQELFGPLGIRKSWIWERDRKQQTQGWAHLHMNVRDWARLAQLVLDDGVWRGRRIISKAFMREMLSATPANPAYGLLFWLNSGERYVMPSVYGPDSGDGPAMPAGPSDMVMMVGMLEQRAWIIPSRDLVIVRLGVPGSRELDTRISLFAGRAGQLDHEILRRVLRAVKDVPYDDPGRYQGSDLVLPSLDAGILADATDIGHVLTGLGGPR